MFQDVYTDLERATWSTEAVRVLKSSYNRYIKLLFDEEDGGGYDRITILVRKKNRYIEYHKLMTSVTTELNAAYEEFEKVDKGGLSYFMYEKFVNLLNECRVWMKQDEVVLETIESYVRQSQSQKVLQGSVGSTRDTDSDDKIDERDLQNQVKELQQKIVKLESSINDQGKVQVDDKLLYKFDRSHFFDQIGKLRDMSRENETALAELKSTVEEDYEALRLLKEARAHTHHILHHGQVIQMIPLLYGPQG
jgi:hypothetical protein